MTELKVIDVLVCNQCEESEFVILRDGSVHCASCKNQMRGVFAEVFQFDVEMDLVSFSDSLN